MQLPDFVFLHTADSICKLSPSGGIFKDASVELKETNGLVKVSSTSSVTPLCYIRLRWNIPMPADALWLGDAWERSYGELQWRTADSSRTMPWYFMMKAENYFQGFGVKVRGGALAFWCVDSDGFTLWLDLRCGTQGVVPFGRSILAAEIVDSISENVNFTEAQRRFCAKMCNDPLLPPHAVYGSNNWYYAYGRISSESVLEDTRIIADLTKGFANRPYMVIDAGWQVPEKGKNMPGGQWVCGNVRFPQIEHLAAAMREYDVHPGIWFRPLQNAAPEIPAEWYIQRPENTEFVLDPSIPDVLEFICRDFHRLHDWGFELLKHDFSTYDLFGKWGFNAHPQLATGNWRFADTTRTSAEIIVDFYRAVLKAADGSLILGCNTIGHLGAGLMHLDRTGDDTSGRVWERTLKMGVNTLAFRLGQHNTFFDLDADCIGITPKIPWAKNRIWAELVAKSGTSFFASIQPGVLSEKENAELREFLYIASTRPLHAEPVNSEFSVTPAVWCTEDGELSFEWFDKNGIVPEYIDQGLQR
jgi:alpha-galactosidase-like protein